MYYSFRLSDGQTVSVSTPEALDEDTGREIIQYYGARYGTISYVLDYRELLLKYMQHVVNCEGSWFQPSVGSFQGGPDFTAEEVIELEAIRADDRAVEVVFNTGYTREEYNTLLGRGRL